MSVRHLVGIGCLAVIVAVSGCQLLPGAEGPGGEVTTPAADWETSAVTVVDESMRRTQAGTASESVALRCTVEIQSGAAESLVVRGQFLAGNGSVVGTVYSNVYTVEAGGSITVTLSFPQEGSAARVVDRGACSVGTT